MKGTEYGHYGTTAGTELTTTAFDERQIQAMLAINDSYSFHVRQFCTWLQAKQRFVDEEAIRDYFRYLSEETRYSAGTVRIKRAACKKRIRLVARDWDLETQTKLETALKNVDKDVPSPSVASASVGREKLISGEEYRILQAGCRSKRTRLMMEFLYVTGCRVSEMTATMICDCEDIGRGAVLITVMGKRSKERSVKVPADLYGRIREEFTGTTYLFETTAGNPVLRTYVSDEIRKLGRRLLKRTIGPHMFRHSFATRMVKKTGRIKGVSEYLGHASVSITMQFYVHEQLDEADLFSLDDLSA